MTKLDDFLDPLFSGTREVEIPKSQVTEPLDELWKGSKINIPSPNMIASYRKGRLHIHEYGNEYRVHLDKYDPEKHPAMHLVDDAPLVLMIWGTVTALSLQASATAQGKEDKRIKDLKGTYWLKVLLGGILLVGGVMLMLSPLHYAGIAFEKVLPVIIIGVGLLLMFRAFRQNENSNRGARMAIGAAIVILGFSSFYFWEYAAIIVLLILALWFIGSAVLSIRSSLGRTNVPRREFAAKLALGIASLILGVLIFFMPVKVVGLLFFLFGVIGALAGILLIVSGLAFRRISKEMAGQSGPGGPGRMAP
jgi:uncharacterized membrane protein HdeD (DUF308 family)